MFKVLVLKEARDLLLSTKFIIAFAVCALLILLSFFMGAEDFNGAQARYEAAKAENLRHLEGLTDWFSVGQNRIFLPPDPVEALVTGVSNDIGRTIEVEGRGELSANDSRYSDEPIFAMFRFLDLAFIFTVVLSLFAILTGYDAVCGEKEQGTLRLAFANSLSRRIYLAGKFVGSFIALVIPLLLALALGSLILLIMGLPLDGGDWLRLILIVVTGLLYFGAFLTMSIFLSALTKRSSSSFLIMLVIWIFSVLIIPRASVLLAGRAVDVPSVDEISTQKAVYRSELWEEDRKKMGNFKSGNEDDAEKLMDEFNRHMEKIADERDKKMSEFSGRLNEKRRNAQNRREKLAFSLARLSPSGSLTLALSSLAGTSLALKDRFLSEAQAYQDVYGAFMKEKTGINPGGRILMFKVDTDDGEEPEEIDPTELPEFNFKGIPLTESINAALPDMGILALFNIIFLFGALAAFSKYDLR